jgi:hypothetical protein
MTTDYRSDPNWPELSKNFPNMTIEELIVRKFELRDEILSIEHQLDMASALEKNGGEQPDPAWIARADMARKARQRYVDEINERIEIRRQEAHA